MGKLLMIINKDKFSYSVNNFLISFNKKNVIIDNNYKKKKKILCIKF